MPEERSPQVLVIFVGLMMGNALAALDTTMVATATPTIVGDLHGLRDLSWIATAYLLGGIACMPIYGKLGDLYGRKRIFATAMCIFLAGSVLCGTAQSMTALIVFRGIQGIGAGGLVALPMAMLADLVPARELGRWIGYSGFVFAFASIAGPLVGGVFTEQASWRWAFLVNVPLGAISLAIVFRYLQLPARRSEHRIDWVGAACTVGAVTCIVLLTSWGGSRQPWGSPLILSLAVGAVLLVGALVVRERRAVEPILPPRVFRISTARIAFALNVVAGILFFAALYFMSAFLQFVRGVSPSDTGLYLIPLMFSSVLSTMLVGRLVHRSGRYRIYPIIGSIVATFGVLLLLPLNEDTELSVALAAAAVLGFGLGLSMQVLILAVQNAVELRDIGVATSTSMFSRQFGGALGLALLGSIFNSRLGVWLHRLLPPGLGVTAGDLRGRPETLAGLSASAKHDVGVAFSNSLHTVFLACVPVALLGIVLALQLKELPLRTHSTLEPGDDLAIALEGAALE